MAAIPPGADMKKTDDYKAKFDFWTADPRHEHQPWEVRIPGLKVKRFSSYKDFNAWKKKQILKLAELPAEEWRILL